ncbi:MAG: hypothetical protein PHW87_10155 [Methanothrix sp.]|nr:hypothetical protein [Methanothrix sp.]
MDQEIKTYVDWIRVERQLSSSLRALARWGLVALERRQMGMAAVVRAREVGI